MVPFLVVLAIGAVGVLATFFVLRSRRPDGISIDAFALSEPWRRHVASAQGVQRRYTAMVSATPAGPLRERLTTIAVQVQHAVEECWHIANRGDEIDEAIHRLRVPSLRTQLGRTTDDEARVSLEAQLASAERLGALRDDADQRLSRLTTRMGELVTQAAEVSVSSDASAELGSAVDDVVTQLEALRLAVNEVNAPGRPSSSP
jgi:hypothetical protein